MKQQFDVLIVGGGVVGLTAALAMAMRNYSVALIDAQVLEAKNIQQDIRVYAINQASERLLNKLNAGQHLDKRRLTPYRKMHVWDGVSKAAIDFDARTIAAPSLGTIMEECVLKQALLQEITQYINISLFPNAAITEVVNLPVGIQISDASTIWQGQLLMIADGANSPLRQKLQVALTSWSYNQQAIIATVTTEQPHKNTAFQIFNPDGPLAFLPLANPNHCSIVWSIDNARAKELMSLDEAAFNIQLSKAFEHHLGETNLISPRHQFPLQMRHAKDYSGANWLLLGDAAHTIHPLAGLGLNLGLADISCWLECLDNSKGKLTSKKVLGAYQRNRKHSVWQTILLMEGFKQLFGNSNAALSTVRGLGLRISNDVHFLKRLFIQHATK